MSPSVICISNTQIAERYYYRDYQPINAFVANRCCFRHAVAKKGVERQKPAVARVESADRRSLLSHRAVMCVHVQIDIWPGLIAVFLIMTLMNDVYRVSDELNSTRLLRWARSSAQLGALPIRLKANRISLPTVRSLSFSLSLSPLSLSLAFPLLTSVETDLSSTPMAIPIVVHAYRVLV